MQVSRGAFYGYTRYGKHGHAWFDIHIAEIEKAVETVFNEMEQRFGTEKLIAKLKERGYHTCRATVKKIMKRLGLRSIRDGAKRQWRLEHHNPKDHVHHQFNPQSPTAVWVSDMTESAQSTTFASSSTCFPAALSPTGLDYATAPIS